MHGLARVFFYRRDLDGGGSLVGVEGLDSVGGAVADERLHGVAVGVLGRDGLTVHHQLDIPVGDGDEKKSLLKPIENGFWDFVTTIREELNI